MRICRKCHKPSRRSVCETCRRQAKLYVDSQWIGLDRNKPTPQWLKDMQRQLFKN